MRIEWWGGLMLGVVLCGALLSAEPAYQCQQPGLPPNVELSHDLRHVLQRLKVRSPTFRTQCDRLADARNLRVIVKVDVSIPRRCRAFTIIRRYGHQIRADVHVPPGRGLTELIAHEFEHVLEQVEGVDLRLLARTRGSGVREVERELFETERAVRVGRIVADEDYRERNAREVD